MIPLWPGSICSQFLKIPKFCSLLLGVVEKEHNQAVRRHAPYSRGTGGGPPTPPAPRKFFNDQTFNDRTSFNDQTFNEQTFNDQTFNDQTFNDQTFNDRSFNDQTFNAVLRIRMDPELLPVSGSGIKVPDPDPAKSKRAYK